MLHPRMTIMTSSQQPTWEMLPVKINKHVLHQQSSSSVLPLSKVENHEDIPNPVVLRNQTYSIFRILNSSKKLSPRTCKCWLMALACMFGTMPVF